MLRWIVFLAAAVAATFAVGLGLAELLREASERERVQGRSLSEEEAELEISRREPPPRSAE